MKPAPTRQGLAQNLAALAALLAPQATPLSAVELAERSGLTLDGWQREALACTDPRLIVLGCRQSGKSSIAAVLAAHEAMTAAGSLSLLISPSLRQSTELLTKVRRTLLAVEADAPPLEQDSATSLRLCTGSRVISLPASERTIRGFSAPSLIVEDESARVGEALHFSVRPMAAVSQARLVLISSPF